MPQLVYFYVTWHYSRGVRDYFRIWSNFLWLVWNFFSFELLLKTFATPFQRIQEHSRPGFHPDEMLENLVVNLLMRFLGMLLRSFVLLLGTATMVFTLLAGATFFMVWMLAPLLLLLLVVTGILLLFE